MEHMNDNTPELANEMSDHSLRPRQENLKDRALRFLFGDDVFISYSRADAALYAASLANELVKKGFACKFDQWGTQPGKELPFALRMALRRSATFILLGTSGASQSESVEKEIVQFKRTGRMIVPVSFDGALELSSWWSEIQGLFVSTERREALGTGIISDKLMDRIEKTFKFSRRDKRLRRTFSGLAVGLLVISTAVTVWGYTIIRQARNARNELVQTQAQLGEAQGKLANATNDLGVTQGELSKAAAGLKETQTKLTQAGKDLGVAQAETAEAQTLARNAKDETERTRNGNRR